VCLAVLLAAAAFGQAAAPLAFDAADVRVSKPGTIIAPARGADGGELESWDRVLQILKTQEVTVSLWDRAELKGTIQEASPEGLAFIERGKVTNVRREDIARVATRSRKKGAARGLIAGLVLGGALGVANAKLQGAGVGVGTGASIAAIGAAIGAGTGATVTLYKADPKKRPVADRLKPAAD
jgi:hypothetical protein